MRDGRRTHSRGSRLLGAAGTLGCVILLAECSIRTTLPAAAILILAAMAWPLLRTPSASAVALLAVAPFHALSVRFLSLNLLEEVLVLTCLSAAVRLWRGRPLRAVFRLPPPWIGLPATLLLLLTLASAVVPLAHLIRVFNQGPLAYRALHLGRTVFGGATNAASLTWHHLAAFGLLFYLADRPLPGRGPWSVGIVLTAGVGLLGVVSILEAAVGQAYGFQVMVPLFGYAFPGGRVPGLFTWPTQLAVFMNLALPVVLARAVFPEPRYAPGGESPAAPAGRARVGWLPLVGAVLGILGLYLSLTRAGWGGWLLSAALVLILGARAGCSRRRLLISAALLAALLAPLTVRLVTTRAEMKAQEGPEWRGGRAEYVWPAAFNIIREHPLLGSGLGTWRDASRAVSPYSLPERRPERVHAHNIFLQVAAERGIPAALCLAILLAGCWILLLRRARAGDPTWIGLAAALPGFVAHGMLEDAFFAPELFFCFWAIVALLSCRPSDSSARPPPP